MVYNIHKKKERCQRSNKQDLIHIPSFIQQKSHHQSKDREVFSTYVGPIPNQSSLLIIISCLSSRNPPNINGIHVSNMDKVRYANPY